MDLNIACYLTSSLSRNIKPNGKTDNYCILHLCKGFYAFLIDLSAVTWRGWVKKTANSNIYNNLYTFLVFPDWSNLYSTISRNIITLNDNYLW